MAYVWQKGESDTLLTTEFNEGDLIVTVEVVRDTDYQWGVGPADDPHAFRGHFSDTEEPGAIENPRWLPSFTPQWFIPTKPASVLTNEVMAHDTSRTRMEVFADFLEQNIRDAEIAADPDRAEMTAVMVIVKVFLLGVVVGKSSLPGTEIEGALVSDSFLTKVVKNEVETALSLARRKIAALREYLLGGEA